MGWQNRLMDPSNSYKGTVLYWGRGFSSEPRDYGFITASEKDGGIYYFDRGRVEEPSKSPFAGDQVTFSLGDKSDGRHGAFKVAIDTSSLAGEPNPWEATVGRILRRSETSGILETFCGMQAEFHIHSVPGNFSKMNGYVRCRVVASSGDGSTPRSAFDVVPIDFSNPTERERLRAYLSLTDTPSSSQDYYHAIRQAPTEGGAPAGGTDAAEKPDTAEGHWTIKDIRYDRAVGQFNLPNNQRLSVPNRFRKVIGEMTKRVGDGSSARVSALSYLEVAKLFELGKLLEKGKNQPREAERKLQADMKRIESNPKRIAQEFGRQFARWLKSRSIEPKKAILCDRRAQSYRLGEGWIRKKTIVPGDSEAGNRFVASNSDESSVD